MLNLFLYTYTIVLINNFLNFISHINYIVYIYTQNYNLMANTELRIKELCKERGITQAQLADKLGIQAVSFSQAVSRNKFNMDRLAEIADALDVEIPDLFDKPKEGVIRCPHCGKEIKLNPEV